MKKVYNIVLAILVICVFWANITKSNAISNECGHGHHYYDALDEYSQNIYDSVHNTLNEHGHFALFKNGDECDSTVAEIVEDVLFDHPEYVDVSKTFYITGNNFGVITFLYNGIDKDAALAKADEIVAQTEGKDTMTRIRAIYDSLIDGEYTVEGDEAYTIYGAVVNKAASCEGYSEAFSYMLSKIGVNNYCVNNNDYETDITKYHQWNMVEINGTWYSFDATADVGRGTYNGYMVAI